MGIYTVGAIVAVVFGVLVDFVVLRTRLLTRRTFWIAYVIILAFQFLINGLLTGLPVVLYSPDVILGTRLVYAPVEDIGFGFGLVLVTLSAWDWLGRDRAPASPTRGR